MEPYLETSDAWHSAIGQFSGTNTCLSMAGTCRTVIKYSRNEYN